MKIPETIIAEIEKNLKEIGNFGSAGLTVTLHDGKAHLENMETQRMLIKQRWHELCEKDPDAMSPYDSKRSFYKSLQLFRQGKIHPLNMIPCR
jgi:hypothetical protein